MVPPSRFAVKYIKSVHNPLIKHISNLMMHTHLRYAQRSVVVDAPKLVRSLARAGVCPKLKLLLVSDAVLPNSEQSQNALQPLQLPPAEAVVGVSAAVLRALVHNTKHLDLLAEAEMPHTTPETLLSLVTTSDSSTSSDSEEDRVSYFVVLAGVQHPGNIGSIVRSAAGLGWDAVVCVTGEDLETQDSRTRGKRGRGGGGGGDPFCPPAVRASRGACFTVPILQCSNEALCSLLRELSLRLQPKPNGKGSTKKASRGRVKVYFAECNEDTHDAVERVQQHLSHPPQNQNHNQNEAPNCVEGMEEGRIRCVVLVVGSEAHGISANLRATLTSLDKSRNKDVGEARVECTSVTIPMRRRSSGSRTKVPEGLGLSAVDSLNVSVAAALLMYHLKWGVQKAFAVVELPPSCDNRRT